MSDEPIEILRGPAIATKLAAGDDNVISGYCARYGEVDADGEVFTPGVFRESLHEIKAAGLNLPLLWMHDMKQPIGSWREFAEVPEGLWGTARINTDTARGREALSLVRKGDLSGLSVGFTAAVRSGATISRARLMEVSIVSIPSANRARLKLKDVSSVAELTAALAEGRLSKRDLEYIARKSWQGERADPALERLADEIRQARHEIQLITKGL